MDVSAPSGRQFVAVELDISDAIIPVVVFIGLSAGVGLG